jgi:L-fucose isomerase-like protein
MHNIPAVSLGLISVSRDCFPITLSANRRAAVAAAFGDIYECKITVENELDMLKALEDVNRAGVNALVVFLGNFGPETPEVMLAQKFDGPTMFVAAAEDASDKLIDGRGDAYCGMLNCSYNLGLRNIKAFIPEYPVGTAEDIAKMIGECVPEANALLGLKDLKIITFGPRPFDFLACNAPIKKLFDLGVEVQENSELDLLVAFNAHKDDKRIPEVIADMERELGEGNKMSGILPRLAQFELTLLDWAE